MEAGRTGLHLNHPASRLSHSSGETEKPMPRPDLADPEEQALVLRLRSGEARAAEILVERHSVNIFRLAYRLTGNHADADDLVQETFLRALTAIQGFRGDSALGTWLYRIAVNLTVNRARSAAVSRRDGRPVNDLPLSSPGHVERDLAERQREDLVRQAVAGLPPRQREILVLHVYEEWPFRQIAETLGCPIGTAKANFFHAVVNLKKRLGQPPAGPAPGRSDA